MNNKHLLILVKDLSDLAESVSTAESCSIFARVSLQGDDVVFSANKEGMIFFASKLLELASSEHDHSHLHFDNNAMLDDSDCQLILKIEKRPWGQSTKGE